ncbi:MAG: leucyl/phenylalanyl-tRNA--protein transferase [Deltaproteobacteria bacterium]|jgi:leucyl/phenylalanyl-tRNA--protein transferase|nr:leucyl/phenylalanyl-tRNA--protein transferase [Deltaproteobacteria bacterium]MDA8307798.1 leucyl/phenylalanyl-tRNA--protein transferase [Deltaproteobacteria bacterium]
MPVYRLSDELVFPHPSLADPEGLLAVGGDLSPERLLLAYANGIFPWYSDSDPILWWSPDPRLVLFPAELKISRSLMRTIKKQVFKVTVDGAFGKVIRACARTREETWLTAEMIEAYETLHELGFAHSVETFCEDRLVGGLYGVALGRAFFGESMFSVMSDASKVALVCLVQHLSERGFELIDCQMPTEHLKRLGAREIPRKEFLALLRAALDDKWKNSNRCAN